MKLQKKGLFSTLSITFFLVVLLSLSMLYFNHSQETASRLVELNYFHKMNELDNSIRQVYLEKVTQNMTFNLADTSLTIEQTTPDPNLDTILDNLETDLENDFSTVNIDLSGFTATHPLLFSPLNLTQETIGQSVILTPGDDTITSYDLVFLTNTENASCQNDLNAAGTLDLSVVVDSFGDDCSFNQVNANGTIIVNLNPTFSPLYIEISIDENRVLSWEESENFTSTVTANFPSSDATQVIEIPIDIALHNPLFNYHKEDVLKFLIVEN